MHDGKNVLHKLIPMLEPMGLSAITVSVPSALFGRTQGYAFAMVLDPRQVKAAAIHKGGRLVLHSLVCFRRRSGWHSGPG